MSCPPPFAWCAQPNSSIQFVNRIMYDSRTAGLPEGWKLLSCNSNETYITLKKDTTTLLTEAAANAWEHAWGLTGHVSKVVRKHLWGYPGKISHLRLMVSLV